MHAAPDSGSPAGTPETALLDHRINKALDDRGVGSGSGGGGSNLGERLSRLEGAFEQGFKGIRHGQNLLVGVTGAGFVVVVAIVVGLMVYTLQRIDNLPGEFQRMNATLSAAITAAKQQQPQIMVVPQLQIAPPKTDRSSNQMPDGAGLVGQQVLPKIKAKPPH